MSHYLQPATPINGTSGSARVLMSLCWFNGSLCSLIPANSLKNGLVYFLIRVQSASSNGTGINVFFYTQEKSFHDLMITLN